MISYRSTDYMYSYNKMKPTMFSTHLHNYYEFLYFAQGNASYIVEGHEYPAFPGDLFITRPGELHSIVFRTDDDYERHFIQISDDYLKDLEIDMLHLIKSFAFGEGNRIPARCVLNSTIPTFFDRVGSYVSDRREESDTLIKTYIIQLLAEINRLLPSQDNTFIEENDRIRAIKTYINSNIDGNITLDSIAEHTFMDKYYLCHLFRKETGITIKDYINIQRIALAKRLIGNGKSATEVCRECGFSDYSSFYRVFKKHSGKSPRTFFK